MRHTLKKTLKKRNPKLKTRRQSKNTAKKIQHAGNLFSISYAGIPVQGQLLTKSQTAEKPATTIPARFFLILYDPDAPAKDWIHWIATSTQDILPYEGPSPPKGTGTHRYKFALVAGNPPPAPSSRGYQNAAKLAPLNKRVAVAEFLVAAENPA
jgi:phosphatidylethanolamine-binding protein (PEBP) family uncharacterized protein